MISMNDTKVVARHLCKMFRRHDDDVAEAQIVAVLNRLNGATRFEEQRAIINRLKCLEWWPRPFDEQDRIANAVKNMPGWMERK